MSSLDKAYETQIKNIQTKTGKTIPELKSILDASGLSKHSELLAMFKATLGLGHGDANALVHFLQQSDGHNSAQAAGTNEAAIIDEIYSGAKAELRPIYDALMQVILTFGEFEIAPKKGYISLRRKKQFVMIGPATNTRVEVGLNSKELPVNERLVAQPAGSMCNYKVRLTNPHEADQELIDWMKFAYEAAG